MPTELSKSSMWHRSHPMIHNSWSLRSIMCNVQFTFFFFFTKLSLLWTLTTGATKDMGKMLGGEEEKDPDAAKKEEERQEALRQQEEERKAKYAKMEAERENIRQGIRDKVKHTSIHQTNKTDFSPWRVRIHLGTKKNVQPLQGNTTTCLIEHVWPHYLKKDWTLSQRPQCHLHFTLKRI